MNKASFEFNTQLKLDVLISGMTEITVRYVASFDWQNLDEIVIPKGVTRIGGWAFRDCSSLTHITIPDGVTSLGYCTFVCCDELTSVTIGNSVTSIGYGAFAWCARLTDITFEGKTLDEVKAMENYPWDISPEKIRAEVA